MTWFDEFPTYVKALTLSLWGLTACPSHCVSVQLSWRPWAGPPLRLASTRSSETAQTSRYGVSAAFLTAAGEARCGSCC